MGQGYSVSLCEAWRSQEQSQIYEKENKGIIHSLHRKRLAIDLNFHDKDGNYLTQMEHYIPFGKYWESLHPYNRWGGEFKCRSDSNHFQMNDL
jgi:hypothetical protein